MMPYITNSVDIKEGEYTFPLFEGLDNSSIDIVVRQSNNDREYQVILYFEGYPFSTTVIYSGSEI